MEQYRLGGDIKNNQTLNREEGPQNIQIPRRASALINQRVERGFN